LQVSACVSPRWRKERAEPCKRGAQVEVHSG
jgi:hypothetical protein